MFLQRYNPWGKTKQDQLQSWNILTFDPQKTDVDEHIDLINTLGDILGQTKESKRDKFIDTMPTIIQMHLITEKTWEETTKKVKELEHIIRKCDPLAAALPTLAKGTAVPSLYSHIAHSNNKDEMDISQPLKGAHPEQPKSRGGRKGKQPQQKLASTDTRRSIQLRILTIITIMRIIEVNPEVVDPIQAKIQVISSEAKIFMAEANEIKIYTKANIRMMAIKAIITRAIKDFIITHVEISPRVIATAIPEAEAMDEAEAIIVAMVMVGPIIKAMLTINTISIMVMMMSTRQTNMVHHVLYAVAIITLPNIASRESMTSMILWKR